LEAPHRFVTIDSREYPSDPLDLNGKKRPHLFRILREQTSEAGGYHPQPPAFPRFENRKAGQRPVKK
jgi:hypothetical protein